MTGCWRTFKPASGKRQVEIVERGPSFLAHRSGDAVAVAVRDVEPGKAVVGYLDEAPSVEVEVRADIPLGHKVALTDTKSGAATSSSTAYVQQSQQRTLSKVTTSTPTT
jgi:hypothetical protein